MRSKRKTKEQKADEKRWAEAAELFERPGTEALKGSVVISDEEHEEMLELAGGKRKLISLRMPEKSLAAIKEIAAKNDRKYQQLIVQAVDMFIAKANRQGARRKA